MVVKCLKTVQMQCGRFTLVPYVYLGTRPDKGRAGSLPASETSSHLPCGV